MFLPLLQECSFESVSHGLSPESQNFSSKLKNSLGQLFRLTLPLLKCKSKLQISLWKHNHLIFVCLKADTVSFQVYISPNSHMASFCCVWEFAAPKPPHPTEKLFKKSFCRLQLAWSVFLQLLRFYNCFLTQNFSRSNEFIPLRKFHYVFLHWFVVSAKSQDYKKGIITEGKLWESFQALGAFLRTSFWIFVVLRS